MQYPIWTAALHTAMHAPDAATAMTAALLSDSLEDGPLVCGAVRPYRGIPSTRVQPLVWSVGQSLLEPNASVAAFVDLSSYGIKDNDSGCDEYDGYDEHACWQYTQQQQLSCGVLLHRRGVRMCCG